jgi:hypothetical protein
MRKKVLEAPFLPVEINMNELIYDVCLYDD